MMIEESHEGLLSGTGASSVRESRFDEFEVRAQEKFAKAYNGASFEQDLEADVVAVPSAPDIPVGETLFQPDVPIYRKLEDVHAWCMLLTIGAVVGVIGWGTSGVEEQESDAWRTVFIVFYSLYLFEGLVLPFCMGSTFKFLCKMSKNYKHEEEHALFEMMRGSRPRLVMRIECYHYETRTRYVTESYRDSDGNQRTRQRLETYQEKVVTHRAEEQAMYRSWIDLSGPGPKVQDIEEEHIGVMVSVVKDIELADDETERSFKEQQERFIYMHQYRDRHYDFKKGWEIDHFQPSIFLFDPHTTRWYISWWFYFLCTIALLSWPYRVCIIQKMTVATTWRLRAKVSVLERDLI